MKKRNSILRFALFALYTFSVVIVLVLFSSHKSVSMIQDSSFYGVNSVSSMFPMTKPVFKKPVFQSNVSIKEHIQTWKWPSEILNISMIKCEESSSRNGKLLMSKRMPHLDIINFLSRHNDLSINLTNSFISFGAGDSCVWSVQKHCDDANQLLEHSYFGWLIDANQNSFDNMKSYFKSKSFNYTMINAHLNVENIAEICANNFVPRHVDVIKFDFDLNDCLLIEKLLELDYSPLIWQMEFNSFFAPPVLYNWLSSEYPGHPAQLYNECSLQWIVVLMERFSYILFQVDIYDVWFVQKRFFPDSHRSMLLNPLQWWILNFADHNTEDRMKISAQASVMPDVTSFVNDFLGKKFSEWDFDQWSNRSIIEARKILGKSAVGNSKYEMGLDAVRLDLFR